MPSAIEFHATDATCRCTRRNFLRITAFEMALMAVRFTFPTDAAARPPEGRVRLYNGQTAERLTVTYRNSNGFYDQGALNALNHFMRCHHTNESTIMDVRLIEFVNLLQRRIGGVREVHVVSAYRSPEYNEQLIRTGTRAARHSYQSWDRPLTCRCLECRYAPCGK